MLRNKPIFRWIHCLMHDLNTEIACIKLAGVHVIVVSSPSISREFLKKQDSNFASRPKLATSYIVTRGYLSTALAPSGDQWKKMRRVLTSQVFSSEKMRWLHRKRIEEADHLVRNVYKLLALGDGIVNVRDITREFAGNFIRTLVFGQRTLGTQDDDQLVKPQEEHVNALFTIEKYLFAFGISDYIPSLLCFHLDSHQRTIREATAIVDKYHEPILEERIRKKRYMVKNQQEDLLDMLVTLQDEQDNPLLSAEEIKSEVINIMLASVDNPSNAVEWALAEMINQPELLKKAIDEIDMIVGKDRLVQESDFPKLNYVKACAKEAFRLHPVSAFNIPHLAISDATVAGGYFVPQGSHILISQLGLGRNPRTWKHALEFNPERHLGEHVFELMLHDPELNMITFGAGRRGCVGVNLGTSMTIMLLARLLQGFNWSLPSGVDCVVLSESKNDTFLASPLLTQATLRLSKSIVEEL